MQIMYSEQPLQAVLAYYAKGFTPSSPDDTIVKWDAFQDVQKGVILFKFHIENNSDKKEQIAVDKTINNL